MKYYSGRGFLADSDAKKLGLHPDMSLDDLRRFIEQDKGSQTQREYAKKLKVTPQFLHDVLHKRRNPGPKILKTLGIREIVIYRVESAGRSRREEEKT